MKEIIYATNNIGKVKELQAGVGHLVTVRHYKEIAPELDLAISEDGQSYEANALLKAKAYAQALGMGVVADDGGLELNAFPELLGLHTARSFEAGTSDESKNAQILYLYQHLARKNTNRRARLVASLAYCEPSGKSICVTDVLECFIAYQARGNKGYGFDPILWIPSLNQTAGQLPDQDRYAYSPRINAMKKLLQKMEEFS